MIEELVSDYRLWPAIGILLVSSAVYLYCLSKGLRRVIHHYTKRKKELGLED